MKIRVEVPQAPRPHLLRAAIEAVAYRFARVYDALAPLAAPEHDIFAKGCAFLCSP